ncbi:polysaccharide pyruvyl transferase family protein [Marivirga sp. S37H4]|uniref:Polysaccharide pyruvyl transferase family protein n=1 Tax=Marivirga aurantiaca TaxID=2802615 RepID=A0A934X257_9BACT|nr:polysaccharide pyruvyl transferase family protein [Marivirga aurantiaca]MBK6267067.1 polysaccharide pyruvyl transferase family protein [Marivirga aurantiaca]
MLVEIYGARFTNKGAEMMLLSIVEKVREWYPSAKFVLNCSNIDEYNEASKKGFHKRLSFKKSIINISDLSILIPSFLTKKNKIVKNKNIDVVFDASGFAYGDQWTYKMAKSFLIQVKRWRKNNTKVILMPQAFGPFNNVKNEKYTKALIEASNLTFVRDKESLKHVEKLNLSTNVKLSPDFTILLKNKKVDKYDYLSGKICLIPNFKVISTSKVDKTLTEKKYIDLFNNAIDFFQAQNKDVFLLNHEGEKDLQLAKKIIGSKKIEIVSESDPLLLKGIIASSSCVLGSRFHGLVSSLSQGILSFAVGWSHKYEMLFKDFGFSKGILNLEMDKIELFNHLNIRYSEEYKSVISEININSKLLKLKVEEMWDEIYKEINSKN